MTKIDIKALRDKILNYNDLPVEPVKMWGETLYIKTMSGKDREEFEADVMTEDKDGNRNVDMKLFPRYLVIHTLCADPEGQERIFTKQHVNEVNQKAFPNLLKCIEIAQRLNKIQDDPEKNLETISGEGSGSGRPDNAEK